MTKPKREPEVVTERLPYGKPCYLAWLTGYHNQVFGFLGARTTPSLAGRLTTGPKSRIIGQAWEDE